MFLQITSDKFSLYRTEHTFKRMLDAVNSEQIVSAFKYAGKNSLACYPIGNGSNVIFTQETVESVLLKNRLPPTIESLGMGRYKISSSVSIAKILRMCLKEGYESFYYLASVPATVGGALAMNAGRGRIFCETIYDFVESVEFIGDEGVQTWLLDRDELDYRQSPFAPAKGRFITAVTLRFKNGSFAENPIMERQAYSKETQDHSEANCGSVFRECNRHIMKLFREYMPRILGAQWSRKTNNWILNTSKSSRGLLVQITCVKIAHALLARPCKLELTLIK